MEGRICLFAKAEHGKEMAHVHVFIKTIKDDCMLPKIYMGVPAPRPESACLCLRIVCSSDSYF